MSERNEFKYYETEGGELYPVKVLTIKTPKGNLLRLTDCVTGMQIELTFDGDGIGIDLSVEDSEWLKKTLVAS